MKTLLLAAAGAAASLALGGTAAQAQYLPPPAYAYSGYDYAGAEYGANHFTLAGVRAGVTVLGVDLDAHAGLDIGAHGWGGGYGRGYYAPQPAYAPPPQPQPVYQGYAGGFEGGGYGYEAQPIYAPQPAYGYDGGGYGRSYDVPCGCGW